MLAAILPFTPLAAAKAQRPTDAVGAFAIAWEHTRPDGVKYARIEGEPELPASAYRFALYLPRGHVLDYRCGDDVTGLVAAGTLQVQGDPVRSDHHHLTGAALQLPAGQPIRLLALEPTVLLLSGVGPFRCETSP